MPAAASGVRSFPQVHLETLGHPGKPSIIIAANLGGSDRETWRIQGPPAVCVRHGVPEGDGSHAAPGLPAGRLRVEGRPRGEQTERGADTQSEREAFCQVDTQAAGSLVAVNLVRHPPDNSLVVCEPCWPMLGWAGEELAADEP